MNRDSNLYTFVFSIIMVAVVAAALAFAATSLKDIQDNNIRKEKMQNILSTIGIETDREGAEENFKKYIKKEIALNEDSSINTNVKAFDVDLAKELKMPPQKQVCPLYVAEVDGKTYYVIPLRGAGLWDAIWGYISLESDADTVKGVIFDHKGETAGLGAEITEKWFQNQFVKETVFDEQGKIVGITVLKGNGDATGTDKADHEVDAISGATLTGKGVTEMIKERLSHYAAYLKQAAKK